MAVVGGSSDCGLRRCNSHRQCATAVDASTELNAMYDKCFSCLSSDLEEESRNKYNG